MRVAAELSQFGLGYPQIAPGLDAPAKDGYALTPADSQDIGKGVCRSLYIGVSGDVAVDFEGSLNVLFKSVPVGILPIRVIRVLKTGTTATNIVALY